MFSAFWLANVLLKKWSGADVFCTFWLTNVLLATACHFLTSELQKVVRCWCVLYILTDKCASCHSGVPFVDIGASKSGPSIRCFVHFDLNMCFSPQRHTTCPDRNSENLSHNEVLSAFWLTNVLVATAACYLSCLCATATSAPAALASLLSKHQEPRIIEKTQRFATFLTFGVCVSSF